MTILSTKRPDQKLSYGYQWKKHLWSTNWFRYNTIWKNNKISNRKVEDCTTGYSLHYKYTKNHYRLIAVHLNRQKGLYDDPKAIRQIEFVGLLKELDTDCNATDAASNNQSLLFPRKCNSITKDSKLSRKES